MKILKRILILSSIWLSAVQLGAGQVASLPVLEVRGAVDGSCDVTWHGTVGRTFFPQYSDDAVTWNYFPDLDYGSGGEITWNVVCTAETLFMRLIYSDIPTGDPESEDFDFDGFGNLDELRVLGTDPLLYDTDGNGIADGHDDDDADGLPDGWEQVVVRASESDEWTNISQIDQSNAEQAGQETGQGAPPPDPDRLFVEQEEYRYTFSTTTTLGDGLVMYYGGESHEDYDNIQDGVGIYTYEWPLNSADIASAIPGFPADEAGWVEVGEPLFNDIPVSFIEPDGVITLGQHLYAANATFFQSQLRIELNKAAEEEFRLRRSYLHLRRELAPSTNPRVELLDMIEVEFVVAPEETVSAPAQIMVGNSLGSSSAFYTADIAEGYEELLYPVEISFIKPDDESWTEVKPDEQVFLSDEKVKLKILIKGIELTSAELKEAGLHEVHMDSSITNLGFPDHVYEVDQATSSATPPEVIAANGTTEIRVSLDRIDLQQFNLLPGNAGERVSGKTALDYVKDPTVSNSTDSQAFLDTFDSLSGFTFTGYANDKQGVSLFSDPPQSKPHKTFMQAAGAEVLSVTYAGIESRALMMNQSGIFYFSGHGGNGNHEHGPTFEISDTEHDVTAADLAEYWH